MIIPPSRLVMILLSTFGIIFALIALLAPWMSTTGTAVATISLWQECAAFLNISSPGDCPSTVISARVFIVIANLFATVVACLLPMIVFNGSVSRVIQLVTLIASTVTSLGYLIAFGSFSGTAPPTSSLLGTSTHYVAGFAFAVINFLIYGTLCIPLFFVYRRKI